MEGLNIYELGRNLSFQWAYFPIRERRKGKNVFFFTSIQNSKYTYPCSFL